MIISTKKGQASLEYLIILSLAAILIVPTVYVFYSSAQTSTDQTVSQQVVQIGNRVAGAAQSVYSYGSDAKITVSFRMPPNVNRVYIRNSNNPVDLQLPAREVIFEVQANGQPNDIVFFFPVPVQVGNGCGNTATYLDEFTPAFVQPGEKDLTLISCGKNVTMLFS